MFGLKESIPKILEKYLKYMIAIKGCSANTITAFSSDLMQFFNFIQIYKEIQVPVKNFNIFTLLQVKEADVIAFLVYLNISKNNNPYTRQRKVVSLRSFYKWIFLTYSITKNKKNPTLNLEPIKKVERTPKYLTLNQSKEIQKIFDLSNTRFAERNNSIISLFLSSGLRLSELTNIDLKDINFECNSIVIFGKNNKERVVYFNSNCKQALLRYINTRQLSENESKTNLPLFINRKGNRMGKAAVENICKRAYKLMGLDGLGYTPHTLRHTAATLIYIYVKQDILLIKQFLGHESLASTEIYTHLSNERLKFAVENHPLNNYKREGSI